MFTMVASRTTISCTVRIATSATVGCASRRARRLRLLMDGESSAGATEVLADVPCSDEWIVFVGIPVFFRVMMDKADGASSYFSGGCLRLAS